MMWHVWAKLYKNSELVKSLDDLTQVFKQWHEKIDNVMLLYKFKINKVDKYVYVKNINKCYVIIYLLKKY
jgi:hypothetical protein